jgi:hypothetical protein
MFPKSSAVSRRGLEDLIDAMKSIGDLQGETVTPSQLLIPGVTSAGP